MPRIASSIIFCESRSATKTIDRSKKLDLAAAAENRHIRIHFSIPTMDNIVVVVVVVVILIVVVVVVVVNCWANVAQLRLWTFLFFSCL